MLCKHFYFFVIVCKLMHAVVKFAYDNKEIKMLAQHFRYPRGKSGLRRITSIRSSELPGTSNSVFMKQTCFKKLDLFELQTSS